MKSHLLGIEQFQRTNFTLINKSFKSSVTMIASLLAIATACWTELTVAPVSAADQVSTWDGTTNNWSDAARWNTVPTAGLFPNNGNGGFTYDAIINSGNVTLDLDITIELLSLNGGTVGGTFNLTASGLSTWTGGTMTGLGETVADGGLTISGATHKNLTSGRTLTNSGTATWTNTADSNGRIRTGGTGGATINNSGTWEDQN